MNSKKQSSDKKTPAKLKAGFLRKQCVQILLGVLQQRKSLDEQIKIYTANLESSNKGFCQEICYGVLRYYDDLQLTLAPYLKKSIKQKDQDIQLLLLAAVYQLLVLRLPAYAVINESVSATILLKKNWAKALVNAVLRNLQRNLQKDGLAGAEDNDQTQASKVSNFANGLTLSPSMNHPAWVQDLIQQSWPQYSAEIMAANNRQAPMTLRVNVLKGDRTSYLEQLKQQDLNASLCEYSDVGLQLEKACSVDYLPGFGEGFVSVQDEAAQLCARLLDVQNNHVVLDACAAPGGKTCHLLESAPQAKLYAFDVSEQRLGKVRENLERLELQAECLCVDVAEPESWPAYLQAQMFDRILLDAPCSASGVIRRHPDIKFLRRQDDIETLAATQLRLLQVLWPKLKPRGLLLYVTCSVFKQENDEVLASFLAKADDVLIKSIEASWGQLGVYGRQLLPQLHASHDGFYYALLEKRVTEKTASG